MQSDRAVDDRALTISEISALFRVSLRTLRYYEQIGLLSPTRVDRHRVYQPKDMIQLKLIITAKKFGFSLRDIEEMLRPRQSLGQEEAVELVEVLAPEAIAQQIDALERQRAAIEAAIGELTCALERST